MNEQGMCGKTCKCENVKYWWKLITDYGDEVEISHHTEKNVGKYIKANIENGYSFECIKVSEKQFIAYLKNE